MWQAILRAYRKRKYRNGRRFRIAILIDAPIEVEVVDSSKIDEGMLLTRYRTINTWVKDAQAGDFSSPVSVQVSDLRKAETYLRNQKSADDSKR